ncbi:hypothetical protein M378DRAFT_467242 [Amanita muscaria Koide BX008]|uniref:Uncharacterized protein n=1 Tax=Amanita muscaria (strain Koide BX008) TaxID=946122 RepID=A0A0C2W5Z2_AMAMK|nr:hypothetical protein M378DRAFT_467242 [Amanita muscaria Koide BX008]
MVAPLRTAFRQTDLEWYEGDNGPMSNMQVIAPNGSISGFSVRWYCRENAGVIGVSNFKPLTNGCYMTIRYARLKLRPRSRFLLCNPY